MTILHRLRDIAFEMSKNLYLATPLAFKHPDGRVPLGRSRKIVLGCQRIAKVPNGVEKLPKISTGEVGCTNVTDDRRTGDSI